DFEGVEPFLDQYLSHYRPNLKNDTVIGSAEDKNDLEVRQQIHLKMLNGLLETQQIERNTVHKRPRTCLFCSEICSNLPDLFGHMFHEHHFNIGLLDNLIFVESFLNDLEEMIKLKKQCVFCKELFRSGTCFRKHLKSKNHYKINAKDERWDRFYLVNYVNLSKSSIKNAEKDDGPEEENGIDEWDDLKDELDLKTQCLFCDEVLEDPEGCFEHMKSEHGFCLTDIQKRNKLTFYDTMKLINYFRHCQRHEISVFGPDEDIKDLRSRFLESQIPESKFWNKPEFYFPVYEEDPLLTAIGDEDEEMVCN
ncbi:MAG: hypothetical protein EBU93_07950, partial [Chlamydiae bacterium]|nr:hypothetical protein [Chlamydiota bacterium]